MSGKPHRTSESTIPSIMHHECSSGKHFCGSLFPGFSSNGTSMSEKLRVMWIDSMVSKLNFAILGPADIGDRISVMSLWGNSLTGYKRACSTPVRPRSFNKNHSNEHAFENKKEHAMVPSNDRFFQCMVACQTVWMGFWIVGDP